MAFGFHRHFRHRQAAWWTLVVGLVATAAFGWHLHREAVAMDRQRLALRVAEVTSQLDARLEKTEMLLHNLRDYLMWSGENRNDVFARWCYENGLSINCPWLHGILVATNRNSASWPEGVPRSPSAWTTNDWEKITKTAIEHRIACDIVLKSNGTNATQFLTDYDLQGFLRSKTRFSQRVGNSRLGMSEHRIVMLDARSNPLTGTSFLVPLYRPEAAWRLMCWPAFAQTGVSAPPPAGCT